MKNFHKRTLLYGLFEATPTGWQRVLPTRAYPRKEAVRRFQNQLLAYAMGETDYPRELRSVGHEITWAYLRDRRRTVYPAWRGIENPARDTTRCRSCGEFMGDYGCVTVGCRGN